MYGNIGRNKDLFLISLDMAIYGQKLGLRSRLSQLRDLNSRLQPNVKLRMA
jgi:hypothetical protein